jgi:hypothetical protein
MHKYNSSACSKRKEFNAARQALLPDGSFDEASHALAAFLRKAILHSPRKGEAGDA